MIAFLEAVVALLAAAEGAAQLAMGSVPAAALFLLVAGAFAIDADEDRRRG